MAVKKSTLSDPGKVGVGKLAKATWTLANGDTGDPLDAADLSDKTVQAKGTWGVGGTVVIQGSLDGGVTWETLTDPQGNALSFTANKLEMVAENVEKIRPNVTAGDSNTALTVIILAKGD